MSRSPLALAAAMLAVPVALGVLPSALAAPTNAKALKGAQASGLVAPTTAEPTADATGSRVVVGVIDTGINPYHEAFQRETPSVTPEVLAEFGITPDRVVTLTRTGDPEADFAADKPFWDSVQPGTPYWFAGTNIIAASFAPGSRPILPDDAEDTHGVGVTAAVLNANPEAVVLFSEGYVTEAEQYTFTHPAVDVVTTSYGAIGSPPLGEHLASSYAGVVELGKVHTGASDNTPAYSGFDGTSGPWWSVGIAGFEEGSAEGRQLVSGNVIDFLGDFTQTLPYCDLCQDGGEQEVGGTSFATPKSAGVFSKVLLEARRAAGHVGGIVTEGVEQPLLVAAGGTTLTNWQLRRALEEAAYVPAAGDYVLGADLTSAPVVDAAAAPQTGWGVLTDDPEHGVITEALAQVGVGGEPTRTKSAETCAFNTAQFELRKAYWDNLALFSESAGTTEDPYVRC